MWVLAKKVRAAIANDMLNKTVTRISMHLRKLVQIRLGHQMCAVAYGRLIRSLTMNYTQMIFMYIT